MSKNQLAFASSSRRDDEELPVELVEARVAISELPVDMALDRGRDPKPAIVPFSAASSEKGTDEASGNDGGSTRVYGPMVRRRVERIPDRLPRVGERPAGAEMGEDLAAAVLSLAMGDLGCRMRRGLVLALTGLTRARTVALGGGVAATALVKTNEETLFSTSWDETPESFARRLTEETGSTFSQSSGARISAFRLETAGQRL